MFESGYVGANLVTLAALKVSKEKLNNIQHSRFRSNGSLQRFQLSLKYRGQPILTTGRVNFFIQKHFIFVVSPFHWETDSLKMTFAQIIEDFQTWLVECGESSKQILPDWTNQNMLQTFRYNKLTLKSILINFAMSAEPKSRSDLCNLLRKTQ